MFEALAECIPVRQQRIARLLRAWADRIDRDGAPRLMTASSFTFEHREGIRWRDDGRGCPVWYFERDYHRAHAEADRPARYRLRVQDGRAQIVENETTKVVNVRHEPDLAPCAEEWAEERAEEHTDQGRLTIVTHHVCKRPKHEYGPGSLHLCVCQATDRRRGDGVEWRTVPRSGEDR